MPAQRSPRLQLLAGRRSAVTRALDVVAWIGTAVSLTALLVVAGMLSATVDTAPTPTGVSTGGR